MLWRAGLAHPVEACAGERATARHRAGDAAAGGGAAGRSQPELPWPRYPATEPELGRDAGPRLPVYGDRAGADGRAGACYPGGLVGFQCAGRVLAHRARSDHEGPVVFDGTPFMPFQKLLIANRGEIAIRIARAAGE